MKLVDANLLIYSYDPLSKEHAGARKWLEEAISDAEPFGLPFLAIAAFLRIVTNGRIYERPMRMEEALEVVNSWMEQPNVRAVGPGPQHWKLVQEQLIAADATSRMVTDAHFAALAVEYGATLFTTDRDFARFPALRWTNPLRGR